jgi:hypothetical protein
VPCAAHPRGFLDTKLPWSDAINNNPCGTKALTSVNGADVTAASLCRFHWAMLNGAAALKGVVVTEP